VVGRQLVDARAVLERAGFQVEETRVRSEVDFDRVLDQDPDAGEEAEEGSTVVLEVSNGPGTVLVPTVRNLPQGQAIDELEERGLRANVDRLYHWADDRRVPAENNLAERDLRPTVIARKVSFGSQSDAGAHTRGILMSVLHTLKKRGRDVVAHLKGVLDRLANDIYQDPWPLLFPEGPT
jgi:hypothetical protein